MLAVSHRSNKSQQPLRRLYLISAERDPREEPEKFISLTRDASGEMLPLPPSGTLVRAAKSRELYEITRGVKYIVRDTSRASLNVPLVLDSELDILPHGGVSDTDGVSRG